MKLDRSSYYAPLPALLLDPCNRIADFNPAFEVLLGNAFAISRYDFVGELLTSLTQRYGGNPLQELLPDADRALNSSWRVQCDTASFGTAMLDCTTTNLLDPQTGELAARVLYFTTEKIDRAKELDEAVAREIRRQLNWEAYATAYDHVVSIMPYYQEVLERHYEALRDGDGYEALDLGAGTGNLAVRLLSAGYRVTVVEYSRAMLAKLENKLTDCGRERLTMLHQSAESLPQLADEQFDGVSILLALFDMNHPSHALSEAIRVLRPGGTIVVTEPKAEFSMEPILSAVEQHMRDIGMYDKRERDIQRVFHVNSEDDFNPAKRTDNHLLTAEAIYRLLEEKQFGELSFRDSHFGNCATIVARKPH